MFFLSLRRERFAARSSDGLQLPEVGRLLAVGRTVVNPLLTSENIDLSRNAALQGCYAFVSHPQNERESHVCATN
jgi:hypothetical protein